MRSNHAGGGNRPAFAAAALESGRSTQRLLLLLLLLLVEAVSEQVDLKIIDDERIAEGTGPCTRRSPDVGASPRWRASASATHRARCAANPASTSTWPSRGPSSPSAAAPSSMSPGPRTCCTHASYDPKSSEPDDATPPTLWTPLSSMLHRTTTRCVMRIIHPGPRTMPEDGPVRYVSRSRLVVPTHAGRLVPGRWHPWVSARPPSSRHMTGRFSASKLKQVERRALQLRHELWLVEAEIDRLPPLERRQSGAGRTG